METRLRAGADLNQWEIVVASDSDSEGRPTPPKGSPEASPRPTPPESPSSESYVIFPAPDPASLEEKEDDSGEQSIVVVPRVVRAVQPPVSSPALPAEASEPHVIVHIVPDAGTGDEGGGPPTPQDDQEVSVTAERVKQVSKPPISATRSRGEVRQRGAFTPYNSPQHREESEAVNLGHGSPVPPQLSLLEEGRIASDEKEHTPPSTLRGRRLRRIFITLGDFVLEAGILAAGTFLATRSSSRGSTVSRVALGCTVTLLGQGLLYVGERAVRECRNSSAATYTAKVLHVVNTPIRRIASTIRSLFR